MFVMTGVAHFAPSMRRDMIAIVPPALPAPALLVTRHRRARTRSAQRGCFIRRPASPPRVCLFLLMLVMFPANVYAARMPNPPTSMTSRLDVRTAEEVVYLAAPWWSRSAVASTQAYMNAASFQRS